MFIRLFLKYILAAQLCSRFQQMCLGIACEFLQCTDVLVIDVSIDPDIIIIIKAFFLVHAYVLLRNAMKLEETNISS